VDEGNGEWAWDLIRQAFPDMRHEEREPIPEGVQRKTPGGLKCVLTKSYYRAIAKIALHYYLTRNQRGLTGHELYFKKICQFIRYGEGDRAEFFDKPGPPLVLWLGQKVGDGQTRPTEWGHLLVVIDSEKQAHAQVRLFAGPEVVLEPHRVLIADLGPIVHPCPGSAHVYKFEEMPDISRYSGRVYEESISRLR